MAKKVVRVHNTTRDVDLMTAGRLAANSWTRLKGLIGVKQLDPGDGLLIRPCKGVHCMFMSIPIDVLYVDRADQIVGMDAQMAPWRMGRIYRESAYVIELPAGTIAATDTQVGDSLQVTIT